ncbi:MAG: dTDP-4-dehydrorhamnose 3,5-epimerase family protein [Actinobacteria bacterium]|nr:dTDP-4-dehydrorhamnose 3,5-epimerase family protein [Actinomycetota bacterium]
MIEGVQVVPLQRYDDERGSVLLMLKETDPHFVRFGEIYFSSVNAGVVKGWKQHRRMTANYACVHGRIRVALHDGRGGSSTNGETMELELSPEQYALVVIPPGVWHGFQGLAEPVSILANCATEPSDPDELDRVDPGEGRIPYEWQAPA